MSGAVTHLQVLKAEMSKMSTSRVHFVDMLPMNSFLLFTPSHYRHNVGEDTMRIDGQELFFLACTNSRNTSATRATTTNTFTPKSRIPARAFTIQSTAATATMTPPPISTASTATCLLAGCISLVDILTPFYNPLIILPPNTYNKVARVILYPEVHNDVVHDHNAAVMYPGHEIEPIKHGNVHSMAEWEISV